MTVIRKCREGFLPFIRVGTMRRIREIDLEYYILNPTKKPRTPEPERLVYVGPPADECGFEDNEEERDIEMKELCNKAKPVIDAKKASDVKSPKPIRLSNKPYVGPYPSGFNQTDTQHNADKELVALLGMYSDDVAEEQEELI